jgi:hypothetical protein
VKVVAVTLEPQEKVSEETPQLPLLDVRVNPESEVVAKRSALNFARVVKKKVKTHQCKWHKCHRHTTFQH